MIMNHKSRNIMQVHVSMNKSFFVDIVALVTAMFLMYCD